MKGLDLHREFFAQHGRPLLLQAFPRELSQLGVASVGFGSDRLGADDEVSRDHCWEPGFQIFSDRLPLETLKGIESYLFAHLPWEFRGFARSDCCGSPNTIRAWTVDEFFRSMTGFASPPTQERQWLLIADEALFHVTNGEVFHDPAGDFTRRREAFGYFPENVWHFKLAGRAMRMEVQRYQVERCVAHGEDLAADLMLSEGLREVFHFLCLINRCYAPMDKWLPWVVRRLPVLSSDVVPLVAGIRETTEVRTRLSLYAEIMDRCAGYVYDSSLAAKGQYWWADLREAVAGELRGFSVSGWVGVEYRYSSQFALGGDFRRLLGDGHDGGGS